MYKVFCKWRCWWEYDHSPVLIGWRVLEHSGREPSNPSEQIKLLAEVTTIADAKHPESSIADWWGLGLFLRNCWKECLDGWVKHHPNEGFYLRKLSPALKCGDSTREDEITVPIYFWDIRNDEQMTGYRESIAQIDLMLNAISYIH